MPVGSWVRMAFIASSHSCGDAVSSTTTGPAGMSGDAPASQFGAVSRRTGEGSCDQGSRRHMSTQSGPGPGRPDPGLSAIMSERGQLINLAYRLLGSLADAEDAVQETYARWYAMSRPQQDAIESPGASLTKLATPICLHLLRSPPPRPHPVPRPS